VTKPAKQNRVAQSQNVSTSISSERALAENITTFSLQGKSFPAPAGDNFISFEPASVLERIPPGIQF
jgi:hypothetical protein